MKASHASNAGWDAFCPSIPVAHTDEDKTTPTLTSSPDYRSLPPKGGISDSSILSDPDDLGVYVIRACNSITPPCPIPGVDPGGLAPSSYRTLGTGLDVFSFAGYSGLEWAAPDERRLPDTPCSDIGTAYDRSHHPSFRSSYRRILSLLRNLCPV